MCSWFKVFSRNENPTRALWVWYLDYSKQAELLAFCKAKQINDLYLHADLENLGALSIFQDAANQLGINLHYLEGDINGCQDRITKATNSKLFKSVHLDLEYQKEDLRAFISKAIGIAHFVKWSGSELGIDVETWINDPLYQEYLSFADYLTYMCYSQDANKSLEMISNRGRKPFYIGFETLDDPKEADISFWALGNAELERQISNVITLLKHDRNFKGMAVHDSDSYSRLKD